ncbi:PepSY domain-containing protein [Ancylobacter dichloromethanicus]
MAAQADRVASGVTTALQEFPMTSPTRFLAIAILPLFAFAATPAPAQTPTIGIEEATRIAHDNGMATIAEIEMDDGKWEVEGANAAGRKVGMNIDPTSGKVLKTESD